MSAAEGLRVAIVGVGPKGLYCFERLVFHARRTRTRVTVDLFEPSGEPGAGAVYRSGQPEYLLMNFADELIDAWPEGAVAAAPAQRMSLVEWRDREGLGAGSGYSPRSVVGRYLSLCFEAVMAAARGSVRVRLHSERVRELRPGPRGWTVRTGRAALECDEVMLATGHRGSSHSGAGLPVRYPLGDSLGPDVVPPGAEVIARGMALTFIDVALALTEGRGGSFDSGRGGELSYRSGGEEVASLTAFSRSGLAMEVKPGPDRSDPRVVVAARRGDAALAALEPFSVAGIERELAATAAEILLAERGRGSAPERAGVLTGAFRARLADRIETGGRPQPSPARSLRSSLRAARTRGNGTWALGAAWRALYPTLVARGSHGGIAADEWPRFACLSREMERIAFGPPPVNGAKLAALIGAGKVGFGPPMGSGSGRQPGARPMNGQISIDAVLPPPGAGKGGGDLIDQLLADGHLRQASGGRRGIEVGTNGRCVGADGTPTRGLAAVGRVTEDWVIGNDTLSRRLHPHPERWAQAVVAG